MVGGNLVGIEVVIKPYVVVGAVLFSAVVGIFFGMYPSSKASKKDPIESLRYEWFLKPVDYLAGFYIYAKISILIMKLILVYSRIWFYNIYCGVLLVYL